MDHVSVEAGKWKTGSRELWVYGLVCAVAGDVEFYTFVRSYVDDFPVDIVVCSLSTTIYALCCQRQPKHLGSVPHHPKIGWCLQAAVRRVVLSASKLVYI